MISINNIEGVSPPIPVMARTLEINVLDDVVTANGTLLQT